MREEPLVFIIKDYMHPSRVRVNHATKKDIVVYEAIENLPIVTWPDGRPCALINAWLISRGLELSSTSSLRTYAYHLVHLVRYCFLTKSQFQDLTDQDIQNLSRAIVEEKRADGFRARGHNRCRSILSTSLHFLLWMQSQRLTKRDFRLIGQQHDNHQITVTYKCNGRSYRNYVWHPSFPTLEGATHPKNPIPESLITKIEDCLANDYYSDILPNDYNTIDKFVQERRIFTQWMFKRFGLRPAELVEIDISENKELRKDLLLRIPTKKTRLKHWPTREVAISATDASRISTYLSARESFLYKLTNKTSLQGSTTKLLVGLSGRPLSPGSLTKEMSRVVRKAGISEEKCCLSMYRHRFITRDVLVSLREIIRNHPHHLMATDVTLECILRRTAKKTGHRDIRSLWSYIELAWRDFNLFDGADRALSLRYELDGLATDLRRAIAGNGNSRKPNLESLLSRLDSIIELLE